ncbi:MAG: FAD-dependent oxidoreductase [Candidatus Omnitrophica bacterium]|nr:FAD-dependent oxidoreductase [Candidatus Omnitrophota bacterium]
MQKIAVIGSGISGISAAYMLDGKYDVTLIEKRPRLGGHTHTFKKEDPLTGKKIAVDTGFIVFNEKTYPNFCKFIKKLGVSYVDSDMSFSYHENNPLFYYSSDLWNGLFAQRSNIFNAKFYGLVKDISAFNENAKKDIVKGNTKEKTLGEYIDNYGYGEFFRKKYLYPMAAAIWSSPDKEISSFPCDSFLRFFNNHGLLDVNKGPKWKTIDGGSSSYIEYFKNIFSGKILKGIGVTGVSRGDKVKVFLENGDIHDFDKAVIAVHADQAISMLKDPTPDEKRLLGKWTYSKNDTVLHNDDALMPPFKRAWASWNYRNVPEEGAGRVNVTYYMNRLQKFIGTDNYFVSLNQSRQIKEDKKIFETVYEHPQYTFESMETQKELQKLNGVKNTYFCGSYFGYGFHEDGIRSSVESLKDLGASL